MSFVEKWAIASFAVIIGGALFLVFLNWLEEQILIMRSMDSGDWIGLGVLCAIITVVALFI
tara:strand:- start:31 stop:213 length:183 start_codon:yes stop_codon:yes gene_type:complete